MPVNNRDVKQFPFNIPFSLYDKLKILMIDQMQERKQTTNMTKFLLEILYKYVKDNGENVETMQRQQIVDSVNKAKELLERGHTITKTVCDHWIEVLRPYRFNLKRGDLLDKQIANLILSFERKRNAPSKRKIWRNLNE